MTEPQHLYAVAARVSRLNAAGATPAGAGNMFVTNSLVKVTFTPEYETGDNITKKDGRGNTCLDVKQSDKLKRVTLDSVEFCEGSYELRELVSGGSLIVDGSDTVGYAYPAVGVDPTPYGVGLEVWTCRYEDNSLATDGFPYARWVFPRCKLRPTARTIGAEAESGDYTGFSEENAGFGNGPTNDYLGAVWRAAQVVNAAAYPTVTGLLATPAQV